MGGRAGVRDYGKKAVFAMRSDERGASFLC
jgi:hypothetical protein